ncbi:RWD domain-containing protein 2B isoform X2 [Rana temporaria]|uniref:RWD domain-containing protein 2B isoform X2 n=1 Tax=Rana temporaria TaxID=8407 RepID=UPI001AAC6B15|nr:RWD domain-containing protein 2B isoform X2 [Rana temporaria]
MLSQEEAEAQISELDLLSSMFPGEEEFAVTDQLALAELREFAEKQTAVTPTFTIQFTLTVRLGDGNADNIQDVLSLHCSYPPHYPNVPPEIVVRSPALMRSQQTRLHTDLNTYLKNNCIGDVCILSAVEWVKENYSTYLNMVSPSDHQKGTGMTPEDSIFTRIRKLTWKRILIRHREDVPLSCSPSEVQINIQKLRKFPPLKEMAFDAHGARGNHMDLGQLYQFLQERGCSEVFPMYFGIEGR